MPYSALPDHLNPYKNPDAWKGTDHDHWTISWKVKLMGYFAWGPRATEWWGRWREFPVVLFAAKHRKGLWRWEFGWECNEGVNPQLTFDLDCLRNPEFKSRWYLSRVQYYSKWHFSITWPLFISFHFKFTDKYKIVGYVGAKRDQDWMYMCPAIYLGGSWK